MFGHSQHQQEAAWCQMHPTKVLLQAWENGFLKPRARSGEGESNDNIPTPNFLLPLKEGFFDPYPLDGDGPIEPPEGSKVWVNPGFSRKQEAWENSQRWAKEGHYVICYLPVESSTKLGFQIAKASPPRLTFDSRPYAGCRDIEIIILEPARPHEPEEQAK